MVKIRENNDLEKYQLNKSLIVKLFINKITTL